MKVLAITVEQVVETRYMLPLASKLGAANLNAVLQDKDEIAKYAKISREISSRVVYKREVPYLLRKKKKQT